MWWQKYVARILQTSNSQLSPFLHLLVSRKRKIVSGQNIETSFHPLTVPTCIKYGALCIFDWLKKWKKGDVFKVIIFFSGWRYYWIIWGQHMRKIKRRKKLLVLYWMCLNWRCCCLTILHVILVYCATFYCSLAQEKQRRWRCTQRIAIVV